MTDSPDALAHALAAIVGQSAVSVARADRVAYSRDLWPREVIGVRAGIAAPFSPACIAWPSSTAEVAAVIRLATERGVPIVPYGAGSGVCGGIAPTPESIVLDLKRMRAIEHVDAEQMEVSVGAGAIGQHLEDALAERSLTLGHFPSSIYCSTVGGWLATRSAGQCSGRYGKIEDMVLGLEAVDGTGERRDALRDGENAWLLPLLVGSEGAFAVITHARLRVSAAPVTRAFAAYELGSVAAGLDAIAEIYQSGLRPAVARLYDPFDTFIARRGGGKPSHDEPSHELSTPGFGAKVLRTILSRPRGLNELVSRIPARALGGALLVLVWENAGDLGEVEKSIAHAIALRHGARDLGPAPAHRWLSRRHHVSYRQSPMFAQGAFVDTMEVAATWSRLMPLYEAVRAALSPHVFVMAHFSHAYPDGASIYFTFAGSARDDRDALERYDRAWRDALTAASEAGGVLSHHHGVGRSKAPMLRRDQGIAVDLFRECKLVLDPASVLNPGVLEPRPGSPDDARAQVALPDEHTAPFDLGAQLIHVRHDESVRAVEGRLRPMGLSLGIVGEPPETPVGAWLCAGTPGLERTAHDPVDQLVAGAVIRIGERSLTIRPAPRRAVGPDWVGAVLESRGHLGAVEEAWLVTRRLDAVKTVTIRTPSDRAAARLLLELRSRGHRPLKAEVDRGALTLHYGGPHALLEAWQRDAVTLAIPPSRADEVEGPSAAPSHDSDAHARLLSALATSIDARAPLA